MSEPAVVCREMFATMFRIEKGPTMSESWYYRRGSKVFGPVSTAKLRKLAEDGKLGRENSVKNGIGGAWKPANQLKGLFDGLDDPNDEDDDADEMRFDWDWIGKAFSTFFGRTPNKRVGIGTLLIGCLVMLITAQQVAFHYGGKMPSQPITYLFVFHLSWCFVIFFTRYFPPDADGTHDVDFVWPSITPFWIFVGITLLAWKVGSFAKGILAVAIFGPLTIYCVIGCWAKLDYTVCKERASGVHMFGYTKHSRNVKENDRHEWIVGGIMSASSMYTLLFIRWSDLTEIWNEIAAIGGPG